MLKSYKYRLYPNKQQAEDIDKTIGVCRLVYNLALETRIRAFQAGIKLSAYDLHNQLPELKDAYPWMKDVNSQALCASINKMDLAYKSFYKGGGYPKFKKKKNCGSFECHNGRRRIDWKNSTLSIPIITPIKIVLSRKFEGEIRKVTVSRSTTGKYFASILVKNEVAEPKKAVTTTAIGIDLGISHFAILSTGDKIDNPKFLRASIERLKVLNRRASKKKKGSSNQRKAYHKVAILHERIANQRADFLHKLSTRIVRDSQADTICIESLSVSNMVKNRKLSQAISDASWYQFGRMLEYKANWSGKTLIKIGRFEASSKLCSGCGIKNNELSLSDRQWTCATCGAIHDRDINAAINIKNIGVSGLVQSDVPVESSAKAEAMKQEDSFSVQRP